MWSLFYAMKTKSKTNLKKKCDTLWSEIIRSKGYCEMCGRGNMQLNAHHIVGRVNKALRWDLRNGICLCVWCHKFSPTSAHSDPIGFIEFLKKVRPDDYDYLLVRKNDIKTYRISDYEEIYNNLKRIANEWISYSTVN